MSWLSSIFKRKEASVEEIPQEEVFPINLPVKLLLSAMEDSSVWDCDTEHVEGGHCYLLTNVVTGDEFSWISPRRKSSNIFSYSGRSWMNAAERQAIEKALLRLYSKLEHIKYEKKCGEERAEMFRKYSKYCVPPLVDIVEKNNDR